MCEEKEYKYTITGKIKGKRNCSIGNNPIKKQLYRVFNGMISRCYLSCHKEYPKYGGRGIKVCNKWLNAGGFENFYLWAIKNGFTGEKESNGYNKLTIDRIDNNKDYSPDNCRWVNRIEQARNKSTTIWVEYNGERDTLKSFCNKLGLEYHAVYIRIYRRKWSIEEALSTPIQKDFDILYEGEKYTLKGIARKFGLNASTLKRHFVQNNYDIYKTLEYFKENKNAKNI